MRVARLVATSRRSMGGEHAWVNLDVGIAYVLGRTDRQVIRRDRVRAAGISCSLPKICGGKHQPDERRLFRPLIRKPLMPQAAQSSLGTITRSEQSAIVPRFTAVGPLPQELGTAVRFTASWVVDCARQRRCRAAQCPLTTRQ